MNDPKDIPADEGAMRRHRPVLREGPTSPYAMMEACNGGSWIDHDDHQRAVAVLEDRRAKVWDMYLAMHAERDAARSDLAAAYETAALWKREADGARAELDCYKAMSETRHVVDLTDRCNRLATEIGSARGLLEDARGLLQRAADELRNHWFESVDGEGYNNDGAIAMTGAIEAFLRGGEKGGES